MLPDSWDNLCDHRIPGHLHKQESLGEDPPLLYVSWTVWADRDDNAGCYWTGRSTGLLLSPTARLHSASAAKDLPLLWWNRDHGGGPLDADPGILFQLVPKEWKYGFEVADNLCDNFKYRPGLA